LLKFVDRVTMLVRGGGFKASQILQDKVLSEPRIDVRFHTEAVTFDGAEGKLKTMTVKNTLTGESEQLNPAGAFIFIGLTPNTGFLASTQVWTDKWGFIVAGHDLLHQGERPSAFKTREPFPVETSVPGIFATGDVRAGSTKQVASAAGEGATAALLIREYLTCGFCQRD
jgi:thioredoxin reductase (NADPH)